MFAGANDPSGERRRHRQFVVVAALIVFLALALRVICVAGTKVDYPIRGDINQYVLYAWNLVHHGTFSTALPDAEQVLPDSYRAPGYPAMLALSMFAAGHADLPLRAAGQGQAVLGYASDTWMSYALAIQIVLSAATVLVTILLARFWLARGPALTVGLLVCLWPHLVAFSGTLLSETLFAFAVALSLWLLCLAQKRSTPVMMAAAGISFGCAYLVNPVIFFFPLMIAAMLLRQHQRRLGITLALTFLLAPGVWALRNASVHSASDATERALDTFVIGSWPQFYAAYNSRFDNEISAQIIAAENEEEKLLVRDRWQGLAAMRERMALDPAYYVGWYLLSKPYLLWDWALRAGASDIQFLETASSPWDRYPVLRAVKSVLQAANPLLFIAAASATLLLFWRGLLRRREYDQPLPVILAVLFAYVTCVHVVLQAEPRYSIPFRPVEILLACWLVVHAWTRSVAWVRARKITGAQHAQTDAVIAPQRENSR
jgi:4-amino-4-deoxy-L-arabinose transferase-like glycosyltransferase